LHNNPEDPEVSRTEAQRAKVFKLQIALKKNITIKPKKHQTKDNAARKII
jgi:hypothetical protein